MALTVVAGVGAAAEYRQLPVPLLQAVAPAPGATAVSVREPVRLQFSQTLQSDAFLAAARFVPEQPFTVSWDNTVAVCAPVEPLLPSTTYCFSLTPEIRSPAGVPLSVTVFTTAHYVVYTAPDGVIHVMSEDGSEDIALLAGQAPVWNRRQDRILFSRDGRLMSMNVLAADLRVLIEDPTLSVRFAEPHPRQPFSAVAGANAADVDNMYVFDEQSGALEQLTSFFEPGAIEYVRWSPSGERLAFLRAEQLWLVNRDGTDFRKITPADLRCSHNFSWSPDGERLAFAANNAVWISDIHGRELEKISFEEPTTGAVDWAATGALAYISDGIVLSDPPGSNERRFPSAGDHPAWLADGSTLSYLLPLHNQQKTAQLWLMNTRTRQKKKLREVAAGFFWPRWSAPR